MKTYAFIFARGGSKGVTDKNIKKLNGIPLIHYSIEIAKQIKSINKIFVSTENEKIKEVSNIDGVEIIDRPLNLASDNAPEWEAWRHAIEWVEDKKDFFDIFISIPTTSPLRSTGDVEKCLLALDKRIDMVITMSKSARSPWFNMVKKEKNGCLSLINSEKKGYINRQSAPLTYDMTTVAYVSRPDYIKKSKGIFDGNVHGIEIPVERSIDIDTEFDFKLTELILKQKKDFKIGY